MPRTRLRLRLTLTLTYSLALQVGEIDVLLHCLVDSTKGKTSKVCLAVFPPCKACKACKLSFLLGYLVLYCMCVCMYVCMYVCTLHRRDGGDGMMG